MSLHHTQFGRLPDGRPVDLYTLANTNGMEARVMSYGGTLVSLHVPGRDGRPADVVLGFDRLEPYLGGHPYFGALIGRYANRIAGGRFELDGQAYQLSRNEGPNHLHGGDIGFDRVLWDAAPAESGDSPQLVLSYRSLDGEEGYPGNLDVTVTYTLSPRNELRLDYLATTDRATVLNLTHHAYFDLGATGDVRNHVVRINAERFLPVDRALIPTGELAAVAGTPMDFTRPKPIGSGLGESHEQLRIAGGYDHTWVLNGFPSLSGLAADVHDPASGRGLSLYTTQPGLQFYTGNSLDGRLPGKQGRAYGRHAAFCLETQHFPDSPNRPGFPSVVLRPDEVFSSTTVFGFYVR